MALYAAKESWSSVDIKTVIIREEYVRKSCMDAEIGSAESL